jgi:hypothetical protein
MMYLLAYGGFGVDDQIQAAHVIIIVDNQVYYYFTFFNSLFSYVRRILIK